MCDSMGGWACSVTILVWGPRIVQYCNIVERRAGLMGLSLVQSAVQYSTVQFGCTVYRAVLSCAVQYSTVQFGCTVYSAVLLAREGMCTVIQWPRCTAQWPKCTVQCTVVYS